MFETQIGKKLYHFVLLYRSPAQNQYTFETFAENLELTLDTIFSSNSFLVALLGDFNAKSSACLEKDKTTSICSKIDIVSSQYGYIN